MWHTRASLLFPYRTGTWFQAVPTVQKFATFAPSQLFCYHCLESFAQLCLSQYRSSSRIVTLTTHVQLFKNLKGQERQVAETEPRCHRVTRRAGHQQATQSLSHIRYLTDTRQLTSPQGEADVRSLEGVWCCRRWGGWICLAVDTASEGSPPLLEVGHTHTHTHIVPTSRALIFPAVLLLLVENSNSLSTSPQTRIGNWLLLQQQ